MPLDGHSYLLAQGWAGKGQGLRQGAITRPLAVPQKKNLSGLGKDRDEAFPFWDHLFSAAAKSIQLKVISDDDVSDTGSSEPIYARTTTGILSNRRPVSGLLASEFSKKTPGTNLLSTAKREAAKSSLYARFFRGPVLGPDDASPSIQTQRTAISEAETINGPMSIVSETLERQMHTETSKTLSKKRKRDDGERMGGEKIEKKRGSKSRKLQKREEKKGQRELEAVGGTTKDTENRERKGRKRLKEFKEKARAECQIDGDLPRNEVKLRNEGGKQPVDGSHLMDTPDCRLDRPTKKRKRKSKEA